MTAVDPALYNEDLAPVALAKRTWGIYNYASLWVAMSVCIPTYMLASGLIAGGMSWRQAIGTILLGNLIVLVPMLLNAHAGTKYGIPFPVLVRASFGVRGANVPAVLRAIVACGWFGIQTWIGGQAIFSMLRILNPPATAAPLIPWVCFFAFWLLNMAVVWKGIETIKLLEGIGAPFMLGVGLLLLWWITGKAGGLGPVLSAPGKFKTTAEFLRFFVPSLTGMVGFWATVALNIPDFTRYAKSQRAQIIGQSIGLPPAMTLYAFIGVAVTSASVVLFGQAIWDPVTLLGRFQQPLVAGIALIALLVATLNTNVAANVVSPSNDFSNLNPRLISFRTGGMITGVAGMLMMPWKLLTDFNSYIFGWLVGYSGLLGPIAGIMIADYFLVRKTSLNVDDLYRRGGAYEYSKGINPRALIALAAGIIIALCGLVIPSLRWLYDYAWFVGFAVAAIVYTFSMQRAKMTRKLIIDTDTASDDAVAIIMALRSPLVAVEAITVVAGNCPLPQAVSNALYTAELCGSSVPVFNGAAKPLTRELVVAEWFHGQDGLGDHGYKPAHRTAETEPAVDAIIRLAKANPGIELVTLGPLTNIAQALDRDPGIAQDISRCVIMGGNPVCEGNVTPAAEFNIYVDPEAARKVFHSGLNIEMVGWQICRGAAIFNPQDIAALRALNRPLADFSIVSNSTATQALKIQTGEIGISLPDPTAMGILLHPELCLKSSNHYVEIETQSDITRGMTVVDLLNVTRDERNARIWAQARKAHICWKLDVPAWKQLVIDSMR